MSAVEVRLSDAEVEQLLIAVYPMAGHRQGTILVHGAVKQTVERILAARLAAVPDPSESGLAAALAATLSERVTRALPMGRMLAVGDKESGESYARVNPDALLALIDEALAVRALLDEHASTQPVRGETRGAS